MKRLIPAIAIATLAASTLQASSFVGGTVSTANATPAFSALNARTQPKPSAPLWLAIPDGTSISLTGPCRRYNASYSTILNTFNLKTTPKQQAQAKMGFPRVWCAVWVEKPAGSFSQKWVHANFINLQ
jgi:hypothetical protein